MPHAIVGRIGNTTLARSWRSLRGVAKVLAFNGPLWIGFGLYDGSRHWIVTGGVLVALSLPLFITARFLRRAAIARIRVGESRADLVSRCGKPDGWTVERADGKRFASPQPRLTRDAAYQRPQPEDEVWTWRYGRVNVRLAHDRVEAVEP